MRLKRLSPSCAKVMFWACDVLVLRGRKVAEAIRSMEGTEAT